MSTIQPRQIVLPDLGVTEPVLLSEWLVKLGESVAADDPVVEVMAGPATVDLPSPIDGILVKKLAAEGDLLTIGQPLAAIEGRSL